MEYDLFSFSQNVLQEIPFSSIQRLQGLSSKKVALMQEFVHLLNSLSHYKLENIQDNQQEGLEWTYRVNPNPIATSQ